jgi:hypothetical protein
MAVQPRARAADRLRGRGGPDDATNLAAQLARGQSKLFRSGLYFTVHARGDEELLAESEWIRAVAASLPLDAKPASWRSLQGWVTTLPFAVDALRLRRTMDTDTLVRRALFTHTVVAVLLGEQPDPAGRAALDAAVTATYEKADITSDPATWSRPAPLMRDLAEALAASGDQADRHHPGRSRHAELSPRLGGRRQRRHPDPDAAGSAGDRPGHRGVRAV